MASHDDSKPVAPQEQRDQTGQQDSAGDWAVDAKRWFDQLDFAAIFSQST